MSAVWHVYLPDLFDARCGVLPPLFGGAGTPGKQGVSELDFGPIGLAIGHATDEEGGTGVTVVRHGELPWRGGVALVGRASGTRELASLLPDHLVDRVDAVMLTGGSAYGLDAAAGVMQWMEERGRGFPIAGGVVPLVPAAVIFDLAPLGKFTARPTPEMAYRACAAASTKGFAEGSVGAGTGATVGKVVGLEGAMKGGVGCWMEQSGDVAVGAIAVVNAFGDVLDARGAVLAGARGPDGRFLDSARLLAHSPPARLQERSLGNTTVAVVATNAALSRTGIGQLARAAAAALYRRISPAGTAFDGDIVFALCPHQGVAAPQLQVEALAVRVLEAAIERSVRLARGRDGVPGLADRPSTESAQH
jgi:L-aminopeptidase/D-esterase-like protein